jgi:hypothetical protein
MRETEFQKWILQAFEGDRNIKLFRRNVGAVRTEKSNGRKGFVRFAEAGQSDLWGWIVECRCPFCNSVQYGLHFEIEVKSEDGKLTDKQKEWLEMVAQNNGIAIVLRPIATDPVGLRERICRLLERQLCPKCVEKKKLNP